ncbi:MAG TPA: tetratricopeptide repeat protein [Gemmatimonadales bacterium]|nr:tetratricopeptide repeat protein [Gemmatimonadales bacterium]
MQSPTDLLLDATAATRRGELDRALTGAAEALALFRARGDADGRARAVNLLGAIAFERGDLAAAEGRFAEALSLAITLGEPTLAARASNNLASVAHLRGRPESALSLYRTALLSYQRLGDRRGMAETWHNLALTFRDLERPAEADTSSAEAVRHAGLIGDAATLALATTGRAEAALLRNDLEVAERAIERALALAVEGNDPLGAVEARHLRARLLLRRGAASAALDEALGAREIARELGSALLAAECTAVAALAARRTGWSEEAERYREEARASFGELDATNYLRRFDEAWEE